MNALNLATACPDPFSTFEFYVHCLRAAGAGTRPWLLLAFDGDRLVGYAAMKQRLHTVLGCRAARIDWLTAYLADRPHVVAACADSGRVAAAVFAYLLGRRSEWSLLEFEQQDADSALRQAALAPGPRAVRVRQFPNMPTGLITIRWPDLGGYVASLSSKARSNVGRQMRALLAAGDVQLLTASTSEAVQALYELYRHVERHSWKGRAEFAAGGDGCTSDFFIGLMQPSQPWQVVIQVLLLDGAPVAGLISARFGKGVYALHSVYDERHAGLGPGSSMMLLGIRQAIDAGAAFVDLQWGSGHYKARWLAQMHETHSLQVYRTGSPFHWRRLLGDLRRRVCRMATPTPRPADPGRSTRPPLQPDTLAERAIAAALVERVRRLAAESLSAAELTAAMPFAMPQAA